MKLSQLTESFVISNDEFEDYLNRATEQLVSELSSGKNPRDAVHDLALTFADQHNKSYDAYQRMAESLGARMHTLEMNSPTDMMNGPKDDMGMGSVDEPEMMSDPMGNMEMNAPASSEMPSDSDMEDYAAVMDNEQEVEESYSPDDEVKEAGGSDKVIFRKFPEGDVIALFPEQDEGRDTINSYMTVGQHSEASKSLIDELEPASPEEYADLMSELKEIGYNPIINEAPFSKSEGSDEEKTRRRALDLADEPERGEERKKVSLKKAPWEESVNEEVDGKAIDTIRKIADEKSAMKIKFDNGTMMVDMFTASAVKSVYDNVNDANKEKLDNLMKTKEGMMKVANLSMKMLKEGRLDEFFFLPAIAAAAKAAGAVAGAARAAGGLGKAAKSAAAGGLGKAAKVARTASGAAAIGNIAKGVGNIFSDPTYKHATGKHLEHIDWRLEMKADDIMNSAIDKVNKK